jgi:putative ABC exporter
VNRALLYLWLALLRRKALKFGRSLRRPTSLVGFLAVVSLLGFLFYFRQHKFMGELVRRENLMGGALVMLCGSLFKGFLQRGLVCEPADIEFLFTSPFTQRQIIIYRLLPNYLFAVFQSLVFLGLFASHFQHPVLTALCLTLFQIACFHLATAATIFGGSIPEETHYRLRWMMLGVCFVISAMYLRLAWGFRIVPAFCSSPAVQFLFYPAVTLPDAVNAIAIHQWVLSLGLTGTIPKQQFWHSALYFAGFALAALASLWLLLQFKTNIFEAALGTTTRVAENRRRLQQGRTTTPERPRVVQSFGLPRSALFRGVGAILWKNLVAVRRSKKEMWVASLFVFIYAGFLTALLWIYHDLAKKAGGAPLYEARGFTSGIAAFLAMLAFFLQRMFPFDFRRDGHHLLSFRTLPVSPLALSLAEVAVPTTLCLAAQACGVIPLIIFGKFDWPTLVFIVLGYPAVSLALNSVWNLHYLLAAAKQAEGRPASSAVGMVMIVALSFLVFYPAGWTTIKVANHFIEDQTLAFTLAGAAGLAVQYSIDLLLLLAMARLFQRVEISRDS